MKKKSHILLFILSGILFCLTPTSYAQTFEPDHGGNRTSVTDSILTGTIDTSQVSATTPGTVWTGKYALYEGPESRYKHSVKLPKFYEPFGTDYMVPWKLVPTDKSDVVSYPEQRHTITLVEMDAQAPQEPLLQDLFNGIYNSQDIRFTVKTEGILRRNTTWDTNGNGKLDMSSSGFLTNETTEMMVLRNLSYGEITGFLQVVASQPQLKEASELAILRLMNALEVKDYPRFYQLLEADNNKLLRHLAGQMHDMSVYFWTDKKNYTNFIGELVAMFNSDNGATIALSGGTALATKVHCVRRAWALAEVAGAAGNIAVNTTSTSPELREVIDIYNLAIGLIGFKSIGEGVVKYSKELPISTKQLLQKNEAGANDLWLPGGKLPDGKLEAVTDPIPVSNIRASKIIN